MRIALFTETFLPKVDGIVTTLAQTVRELNRHGHQVLIFAPGEGEDRFEQSRIVRMKGHSFPFYPELKLALPHASMREILQEFQPDLLHVAEPALLGIAGLYYAGGVNGGALGLPLVVSYHTDLPKYLRYYKLGFLESRVWQILRLRHNRATVNLCTSRTVAHEMEAHGIHRVALWPGGVDSERFHPAQRSDAMRSRLTQGHPQAPLLLYVGRLSPEKGLETLKLILQAIPDARLALIGDGPHRKELERHFAGLPVFMPGFLRGNELAAAYASSDIFVMPSRTETLGLVVLEAMASGLPVVGARAGGIPEMIEHGVSGFLFDDPSQAVAAIRPLLGSGQKREAMGIVARNEAIGRSWQYATQILLEHYRAACLQQHIAPNPASPQKATGFRDRGRKALRRSTIFAIRKLLP